MRNSGRLKEFERTERSTCVLITGTLQTLKNDHRVQFHVHTCKTVVAFTIKNFNYKQDHRKDNR